MSDKYLEQVKYLNASFDMVHSSTANIPANSDGDYGAHLRKVTDHFSFFNSSFHN